MSLFAVVTLDKPDSFDLRAATRDRHLAWLGQHADRVRLAGPFLDPDGRSTGSLLIVEAVDLVEAQAWAAQDPYVEAGLFASTRVAAWKRAVGGFGVGA